MIIFAKAHPATRTMRGGDPTPEQAASGKYPKERMPWRGLTIAIEHPEGTVREGVDEIGKPWRTVFRYAYGEILGTTGLDGDPVDVFIGSYPDAPEVYVVQQMKRKQWNKPDEQKCMINFASIDEAKAAYLGHYDDPRFFGGITAMPVDEFVAKVRATKEKPAMIKSILFFKGYVGPYLRGGRIVNVRGYHGRAAHGTPGGHGQLSLFGSNTPLPPSPLKGKDPVASTPDLFAEDVQRIDSNLSNNEGMEKDLSSLAQEFMSAYADDPRGVFLSVRDELRAVASDRADFSVDAVKFLKEMDKDQQEAFVVEHVVPALRAVGWPKPHTKPMADAIWSVADRSWRRKEPTHTEPTRELIAEHERLVDVLNSPSHADDKAEAKKQAAELAEMKQEVGEHDHLLADIPGAKWRRGKGLIAGHYGVEVDGEVHGNYHANPEDAVAAAKQSLAYRAAGEKAQDEHADAVGKVRERLMSGGEATDADLKLLGLKDGASGLEWFIPAAAKVFGISSRAVRPYIKDLIKIGHTDMGAKKEFVAPKKGLQAIAAAHKPEVGSASKPDPEADLRAMWTKQGVSKERQDELIAQIGAKAASGAKVGPFAVGRDPKADHRAAVTGAQEVGDREPDWSPVDAEREIARHMDADEDYNDFGLRIIPEGHEVKTGAVLPRSKRWEDGVDTGDELDGTSTIGIASTDKIKRAISDLMRAGYQGKQIVLVKGEGKGAGADAGEKLIKDPEVIATWRIPAMTKSIIFLRRQSVHSE